MPGIKIDTTRMVDKIDNLEFQTFKMKVEYPNKMVIEGKGDKERCIKRQTFEELIRYYRKN